MNVLYLLSHRRQLEQPKKLAGTDVISFIIHYQLVYMSYYTNMPIGVYIWIIGFLLSTLITVWGIIALCKHNSRSKH
jgi:hypothetical protein